MNLAQMTPAQREVAAKLYVPAFLSKMAELGRPIQTAEQLDDALETVALLKAAQLQAQAAPDMHKTANARLKAALGMQPGVDEPLRKMAERLVAEDPQLAAALLTAPEAPAK